MKVHLEARQAAVVRMKGKGWGTHIYSPGVNKDKAAFMAWRNRQGIGQKEFQSDIAKGLEREEGVDLGHFKSQSAITTEKKTQPFRLRYPIDYNPCHSSRDTNTRKK